MTTQMRTAGSGVVPYRLTARQFEGMIAAGVFPDEARVELLGGMLVDKMTKNDPHDFAVARLGDSLRGLLPLDWIVREEKSLRLGRFWRPEPDLVVARGPHEAYRAGAPRAADVALLAEVADTTYLKDRGAKWRSYASAGIPVYWIVNLPQRRVEVYSAPSGRGKAAVYRDFLPYGPDDEVSVQINGREVGRILVRELLP
jgi:Uma2 family endonuclease